MAQDDGVVDRRASGGGGDVAVESDGIAAVRNRREGVARIELDGADGDIGIEGDVGLGGAGGEVDALAGGGNAVALPVVGIGEQGIGAGAGPDGGGQKSARFERFKASAGARGRSSEMGTTAARK